MRTVKPLVLSTPDGTDYLEFLAHMRYPIWRTDARLYLQCEPIKSQIIIAFFDRLEPVPVDVAGMLTLVALAMLEDR